MANLTRLSLAYGFNVRVLLHDINDYTALHEAMKQGGFVRFTNIDGKFYELLPGEYRYNSDKSTNEVFDEAVKVIRTLYDEDQLAITVFGREERISHGLKEVTADFANK